jgi:hypothetical protein
MIRMNSMRTGACVAVIAAAGCGVTQAAVPEGRSAAPGTHGRRRATLD